MDLVEFGKFIDVAGRLKVQGIYVGYQVVIEIETANGGIIDCLIKDVEFNQDGVVIPDRKGQPYKIHVDNIDNIQDLQPYRMLDMIQELRKEIRKAKEIAEECNKRIGYLKE